MRAWCSGLVVVALCACAPKDLLTATAGYATVAASSTTQLAAAPGILSALCRQRLELEYLTQRLVPGQPASGLEGFVDRPFKTAGGHLDITWRQRCAGMQRAETAFAAALGALATYSAALGELAGKDVAAESDIKDLAKAASAAAGKLADSAVPYQPAIEGLGPPLADLAQSLEGNWRARHLAAVIARSDKPLREIIARLHDFIHVARARQLKDVRVALGDLVLALDQTRAPNDVATLVLTARIDIEVTDRLDQLDSQLKSMTDILDLLADAHGTLKDAWDKGDIAGVDTVRAMAALAKHVYADVKAFENPTPGGT